MIIIGEKINTIIPSVKDIVKGKKVEALQKLAQEQIAAGATMLDVNVEDLETASTERSIENIKWAIKAIQEIPFVPLVIDSPNPQVMKAGLEIYDFCQSKPILNALAEKNKEEVAKLVFEYDCGLIVLIDTTAQKNVEEKVINAKKFLENLRENNISLQNIYIDPGVAPIGVNSRAALDCIDTIKRVKTELKLKTVSAPSNISYGFNKRSPMNRVFIKMLEEVEIDALICNPRDVGVKLSQETFEVVYQALMGRDRRFKAYRRYLSK